MCDTKVCKRCGIVKTLDSFERNSQLKDGHGNVCRVCRSLLRRERYKTNREKELAVNRAWREANRDRMRELGKRWKQENKEYYAAQQKAYNDTRRDLNSEYSKQWYQENKERKLTLGRLWYSNNKEYKDAQNRQWRKDNPDKARQIAKLYRMVNVDRARAFTSAYRAKKLQATPLWLDDSQIEEIMDLHKAARMFQIYTGIDYQVDHIVPLQGDIVCGLHVPWNLQLLSSFENQSKGNRYWPDMPEPE